MDVLLEDMAATLGATVTLPDSAVPAEGLAMSQPSTVPSSLGPPEKLTPFSYASTVLAHPLVAFDAPRDSSPPLPVSPPVLVHELSSMTLAEVDPNTAQTRGSWARTRGGMLSYGETGCAIGERTGGEAFGRVKARG